MAMFARRRWPWAVAAVGVVAVLALVVALLVRDDDPAPTAGPGDPEIVETADPVPEPTLPAVTFDALVTAPDTQLRTYADHQVTADGARVLAVVDAGAVWVGESAEDRVLVVLVSTENPFRFDAGTRIGFTGVVRPTDPAFARSLGLSPADRADLSRQRTYVEITEYRTA